MRISDWSSDVCSSDLKRPTPPTARKPTGPTADELGERGRLRLLQLIRKSSGINVRERSDITGERGRAGARAAPGLFRKEGRGIDDIATLMHEAGFLTDADLDVGDGGDRESTRLTSSP